MFVELKQRHVEAIAGVVEHMAENGAHKTRRLIIEAAIDGGWFKEKPQGEVLDWKPSEVIRISGLILEAYNESISLPPS